MSKVALDMDPQPHQAPDGTVVYTYGKGIPVIVCSLLRLTQINLEPGELLEKDGIDMAISTTSKWRRGTPALDRMPSVTS